MSEGTLDASFWDHLEEFRKTLLWIASIVLCGTVLALLCYPYVFQTFTQSLETPSPRGTIEQLSLRKERLINRGDQALSVAVPAGAFVGRELPEGVVREVNRGVEGGSYVLAPGAELDYELKTGSDLVIFGPTEGVVTTLKVSLWVGLVGSSPLWLFLLLRFVSPGLHPNERSLLFPFLGLSTLFIALGLVFALVVTIPFANAFLRAFNEQIGQNLWSLGHYLDFTILLALANALAFELVVVLLFLVHLGTVSAEGLAGKRRHAVVGIAILAAVLTPPDVVTQLLLAGPLWVLYEIAILYARLRARRSGHSS